MKCYGNKDRFLFLILFPDGCFASKLNGIEVVGPTKNYRWHCGSLT